MSIASTAPASTWNPGTLVPGTVYRIIRPIGQGGMGQVFEVEHEMLGTRRALKVLMRHYAGREDLTERLRVEARGLARLKHPNLVEVYDLGTAADGRIFFAMELLDGTTLRELLRTRGRLSVAASIAVVGQMLDGLHAAHQAGMLHRDVKPENVFVCRSGTAKLLDFGVAKAIDAWMPAHQITGAGMTVGTPRYMAPEQAEGRSVDARTDVYAAGLVLWELLVGAPPFDATDPYDLALAKRTKGVPRLSEVMPGGVPSELCDAAARACAIRPKDRYPTAEDFATDLRRTLDPGLRDRTPAPSAAAPSAGPASAQTLGAPPKIDLSAPTLAEHDGFTRVDGAGQMGPGGTIALRGAVQQELTERIELAQMVDRDAPTMAHTGEPRMLGPGGTELLPAVAARRASERPQAMPVTRAAWQQSEGETAQQVAAARRPRVARSGVLASVWFSWVAGLLAFFVPVSVALVFGYRHLWPPAEEPAFASSVPPSTVSAEAEVTPAGAPLVEVADESALAEGEENGAASTPAVRFIPPSPGSAPAASVSAAPHPATVVPAQPEAPAAEAPAPPTTKATKPPPTKSDGAAPARKMPKSGL